MDVFRKLFMKNLTSSIPVFMDRVTKRCRAPAPKDKTLATNYEQLIDYVAKSSLTEMGISWYPAVCQYLSDTAVETDTFILQLDAKVCEYTDGDFVVSKKGLKIHCGEAQTSLSSIAKKVEVKGLQSPVIDGKPVYTYLTFLRWGYKEKYFATSVGLVNIPHDESQRSVLGGKQTSELRMHIKDPLLWDIHSYASGLAPQIQDSALSEPMSDEEFSQLDQLCQNQQMGP